jgi:hypothetical protein
MSLSGIYLQLICHVTVGYIPAADLSCQTVAATGQPHNHAIAESMHEHSLKLSCDYCLTSACTLIVQRLVGSSVIIARAGMAGIDQPVSLKYFDLKGHGGLCGLGGGIRFFFYTQGIQ